MDGRTIGAVFASAVSAHGDRPFLSVPANAARGLKRVVFCCFSPESAEHHRNVFGELGLA